MCKRYSLVHECCGYPQELSDDYKCIASSIIIKGNYFTYRGARKAYCGYVAKYLLDYFQSTKKYKEFNLPEYADLLQITFIDGNEDKIYIAKERRKYFEKVDNPQNTFTEH